MCKCFASCVTVRVLSPPFIVQMFNLLQTVPLLSSGVPISDRPFTRTSLLGFVGPVSFNSFVCCLETKEQSRLFYAETDIEYHHFCNDCRCILYVLFTNHSPAEIATLSYETVSSLFSKTVFFP